MVSINTVESQNELIPEWKSEKGFTFPILVGATRQFLVENYDYQGSPTNFLLNQDGRVVFKHVGYGPGGEKVMEAEIRELLGLDPFQGVDAEEKSDSR